MAYNLDENPKFFLETYKEKIDNTHIHEFIDHKINFKQKFHICYKFQITRYRTTCEKCNLSLCKLYAKECYNHIFSQMNIEAVVTQVQLNNRRIIDQLLKRIEQLEREN